MLAKSRLPFPTFISWRILVASKNLAKQVKTNISSLRRGDLISRSCLCVGPMVRHRFCNSSKREVSRLKWQLFQYDQAYIAKFTSPRGYLRYSTNLINLLILFEVTAGAMYVCSSVNYGCRRLLSEDSELVNLC